MDDRKALAGGSGGRRLWLCPHRLVRSGDSDAVDRLQFKGKLVEAAALRFSLPVGPGACCPPRHPTYFEPSSLELDSSL